MPCGLMDQYVAVQGRAGHLVLLDCRARSSRLVPFDDPDVAVLIADSRVKHELTGSEYAERRAQCEQAARMLGVSSLREVTPADLDRQGASLPPVVLRRARHVVAEIARTADAAELAQRRDWTGFGTLMDASHRSLRDDYEVSCPELDALVEAAWAIGPEGGVLGSRMTGGGFGGCTVSLVAADRVESISRRLRDAYAGRTGLEPELFATRPADGARALTPGC
jgi:galactokinase